MVTKVVVLDDAQSALTPRQVFEAYLPSVVTVRRDYDTIRTDQEHPLISAALGAIGENEPYPVLAMVGSCAWVQDRGCGGSVVARR